MKLVAHGDCGRSGPLACGEYQRRADQECQQGSEMAQYDVQVIDVLEKFITKTERKTTAEIVLVIAHRSQAYVDVRWKAGSVLALVTLVLLVILPVSFEPGLLFLDLALGFGVGYLIGRRSHQLTRLLTHTRRQTESVLQRAQAVFTQRGVTLTRERTGVMIFVSLLEKRALVLADVGIERKIPPDEWNAACLKFSTTDLFDALERKLPTAFTPCTMLLKQYLPSRQDNPDEIPNRPVVLE